MGLSPRVWGSLQRCAEEWDVNRSIPTCVGQPISAASFLSIEGVYPHVCGAA